MPCFPVYSPLPAFLQELPAVGTLAKAGRPRRFHFAFLLLLAVGVFVSLPASAVILWNDPGPRLIHENGAGTDILGGAVKRDESANDTLYFKIHVEPLSDKDAEAYYAGFELFEGDTERLGIGNSLSAWAYSAFFHADQTAETNNPDVYIDLRTTKPESPASASYQYPRRGVGATIVFKIQFVPGEDDLVTVWLNPDLGPGANEAYQPESLTTRFNANASFDEIRLRHGGRGDGWLFSDLAIATTFTDFVDVSSARPNDMASSALGGVRAINFQSWQKDQGLPPGPVHALTQTRDGYLWIGSDDGVGRFDGARFVRFGLQEGFNLGPVSTLLEDDHGALWIGSTGNGLHQWQNGKLTAFTANDGLPSLSITAMAKDSAGRPWIGTTMGLVSYQDGKLLSVNGVERFKDRAITALHRDAQGTMWVGVNGLGVFQFTNGAFVSLKDDNAEELKDVRCLLTDTSGRLWVCAGEDFVMCRENDRWRRYRIPHNRASPNSSTLAAGADGTMWAGAGTGGLMEIKDGKSVVIPMGAGMLGHSVESLFADNDGRLWVGTDAALNCLKRKSLFALSQSEGLGFGAVQGVVEATPGVVWAAKPNDGLYRWNGKSFSRLSAEGLSSRDSQITTMLVTRDGFCWVATTNELRLYTDPIAAGDEAKVISSAPTNIIALAEDRRGAVWAGTRAGKIRQLSQGRWFESSDFSQTNPVSCFALGADGSMWAGTEGSGLFRFNNGNYIHLGRKDGMSSDFIRTLYLDAQGTLWIGTDSGLNRWRYGRLTSFTTRDGLPDNTISQILEDEAGRLWLGTGQGIACVSKGRLDDVVSGQSTTVYPKLFGMADGMPSEECSGGFCPAGLKTKSGLLWFSTLKGLVVVDPQALPENPQPPKPILEAVLVDGVAERIPRGPFVGGASPDTLRVTPGKHSVEFRYIGLGFEQPERMHFRYQLEGLDTAWLDAGTRLSVVYSYLPPGDYKFRLAASNGGGIWNEGNAALELVVMRHFWQTWWFVVLVSVGVLALVALIVRAVVRRKMQRRLKLLEQEHALERERTRIAQDLHDEMGAKLCRISFLSEHARRGELPPEELRDQITSISDASREVLHSLDEIVWAVNPQNDTLEHVASYIGQYAEDYFNMTGIHCELEIPAPLPPFHLSSQQRHNLFLATHEAFTNILKHSGATQARVSMVLSNGVFNIDISDNGRGFDAAAAKSKADSANPGDGLINMAVRLNAIGGQCEIQSAPGKGARIKFVVLLGALSKTMQ